MSPELADQLGSVLGAHARALAEPEARSQLAAAERGDPWHSAAEVMALSYVEGRILAVRLSTAAAAAVPALGEARGAAEEAIRCELFSALERVHGEGGRSTSGWIDEAWPGIAQAALARCRSALPAGVEAELAACLPGLLHR